jgi:DNA-binding HxlR family transcriptional regulator
VITETEEGVEFEAEARKATLFRLLGSAHTLAILREFAAEPGPLRFSELRDELGIPPTTLSDRLVELREAGIIDRESHDEVPPRVEYRPTERGEALRPVMDAVADWIEEYET